VATASHVVPIAEINNGMEWRMTVVPASVNGVSVFGAGVATNVSNAVFFSAGGLPPVVPALDMAMLRTFDPIGNLVGFFGGLPQIAQGQDWITSGYGYDRAPLRPKVQINVPALSYDLPGWLGTLPDGSTSIGYEVETKADGANGNSGSPLYKWFNTGGFFPEPLSLGIWSAHQIECAGSNIGNYQVFAGGPLLDRFITWARQNWP
jgi:hypothetical protein